MSAGLLHLLAPLFEAIGSLPGQAFTLLWAPGSPVSLISLACALAIAWLFLSAPRLGRGRPIRPKALLRALFPKRMFRSATSRADLLLLLLNLFVFGAVLGWAVLTYQTVGASTQTLLTRAFGPASPAALSLPVVRALLTLALFLAAELGFWLAHCLCHRVPALWAFHKVHHSAEFLTPATNYRVHPVQGLLFMNLRAVVMGLTFGVITHLVGRPIEPLGFAGQNIILLGCVWLSSHLQHSHLWIAFTGVWGRLFISPAHHQLHHSADPADFDRNFGAYLAVWDWLFGTLRLPSANREPLTVGLGPDPRLHTVKGLLVSPVIEALVGQGEPSAAQGPKPYRIKSLAVRG